MSASLDLAHILSALFSNLLLKNHDLAYGDVRFVAGKGFIPSYSPLFPNKSFLYFMQLHGQ